MYPGRRKTKLPRTSAMNLKTVEVPRGRNGYGFTVSGQSPCVLSCILHGSPAEIAGIKTGDSVIAVNGENVTRLSHEQIIKLIGATTGVLRLTVAEVDYSESSDDEYVYMPRSRYPHNKRSQSATPLSMLGNKPRAEMVVEEMQQGALLDSFSSMHADMPQAMLRGAEVQRIQADLQISSSKFAPGHLSPLNQPGNADVLIKKSSSYDYSYWNGKNVEKVNVPPKTRKPRRHNDPRNRMFSTPTPTSYYIRENPYDDGDPDMRPLSPVELSHLMYPGNDTSHDASRSMHKSMSLPGNASRNVSQGHSMGASLMENNENIHTRAMVGYLGSIDIPASANLPTASLHAIRGCVRRLHKEHRVHSFMMMEVRTDGVRLMNSNQRIAVVYPRERLAFCGVCPDDKRFFGIVTSQNPEEMLDTMDSDDEPIGSSCHVFMVDPEFRRHDVHARVTSQFGIPCNTNPETNTCDIFPSSAKPILQQVSQLYRDRTDLSYFGELYGQSSFVGGPRRSNSTNSSNSDSGFGNGNSKDQTDINAHMDQSHHTPILDVASLMRNNRGGGNRHIVQADVNASLSSDVPYSLSSTSPQSIDTSPQNMFFKSTKDISGRLTPRARPDPVGFRSPSVVPQQQENARNRYQQAARPASVQVPLQSHIQHSATPELKQFKQPGIDFNSHKPNAESSGSSTLEDNSQRGKGMMGPPKGLPPTGRHSLYNKSSQDYLDAAIDQTTAKKVQEEMARILSETHSFHHKQQLLRRNSDCSEYSSSTRLSKQTVERLQKIRQDPTHLAPPNQQTLAPSDGELNHDGRGGIHGSASNPNLAAQGSTLAELDPSIGRVSSWAVDFERLLADELGLACFTEFLKKEFSDENIMFWIACENMSKIKDHKELQRTAQEIYVKHLAPKALMPVNLDSGARSMVEGAIKNPTPEMYKIQQQQIFKLMKFDSYSRFLKSKLYQDCVLAEMGGLPLPISLEKVPSVEAPAGDLEDSGGVHGGSGGIASESGSYERAGGEKNGGVALGGTVKDRMERKKSENKRDTKRTIKKKRMFLKKNGIPNEKEEDVQDKKRSSILPWRNKQKKAKDVDKTSSGNEEASLSSRHSSVTSSDFRPAGDKFVDMNRCFHMIFPNNEILTLTPEPQQSVKGILLPLLEERGLGLQNVETFLNDTKELINLEQLATEMIGKQIVVERRVVFKIELPNKRVIGVKSKLTKKIIEVLRPVTYKYKLQLDALVVHLSDSPVPLDLDITVSSLDGQRILIETLEQYSAGSYSIGGRASVGPTSDSQQKPTEMRSSSVDSYLKDDEAVRADSSKPVKEKLTAQVSAPTMSVFQAPPQGDTMRDQRNLAAAAAKAVPQVKHLPPSSKSSVSTSALGKGRTEGRAEARRAAGNLRVTGKDTEDLIAMVTKLQGKRLDDQRGLTLRNLELPDFLKVSVAHSSSSTSTKPVDSRPKSALAQPYQTNAAALKQPNQPQGELKAVNIEALQLRPKSTPPRQSTLKSDHNAFTDGILPTQDQADALFGSGSPRSPVVRFDDSVVSSSYRETSWSRESYVNYPQSTDKMRPSVANSYPSGTSSFQTPDNNKLSPRAYGNGRINRNDSTDYGQNTTAYSLEFNSSFGSVDQPNLLDTTLTSTSSDTHLPPPPMQDLDTTIQADLPNYTPPPAIGINHPSPSIFAKIGSQSNPDVRKNPIMHPFRSGSTLPGHGPDITPKPVVESNGYVSKAYPRSISTGQLSYSNNNNTGVPLTTSAPDIKVETNNCYSNYCPLPTTPNGSSYGGSSTNIDDLPTSPTSPAPPDVTQVHAKERVIKPPPAYHSSMATRQPNAAYTSSEDLRAAPPAQPTGQVNQQGARQGGTWSTSTAHPGSIQQAGRPSQGATWAGPRGNAPKLPMSTNSASASRGYRGPVPYASVQPPKIPTNTQGAVAKPSISSARGGYSETNNLGAGASGGASGGAQGGEGSGEDFQGKETMVISKDGRKLRATFV